jgi:anaerobic magnesium-protoporphyrin IX monomethyl ester cyclase
MKSILISPPHIPTYINTDYNFVEIGEVAAYLVQRGHYLDVFDGGVPGQTWQDVINLLLDEPSLLIIHCTLENMTEVNRLYTMVREVVPQCKVACYGRGAYHVSHLLKTLEVDWIVTSQDWELALDTIVQYVEKKTCQVVPGTLTRHGSSYEFGGPGKHLHGEWSLPLLSKLPIDKYRNIPADEYSARGYGNNFEFAIGISRGCNLSCGYCPIPKVMGTTEIFRQNLDETIEYLTNAFERYGFTAVSLFGANFTYDAEYVKRFCRLIANASRPLRWKCVTSPSYLNSALIEAMAQAGCDRIAVGVESIRVDGTNRFPGRVTASDLNTLAKICKQNDVMLVCFIMAGLPGQTSEELAITLEIISESDAIPRPMVYYDFESLNSLRDINDVFWSNRKTRHQSHVRSNIPVDELMLVANNWPKWLAHYRGRN